MHEVFLTRKEAAEQRFSEAEELFAPIAKTLDLYFASFLDIQGIKAYALNKFHEELMEVTAKHFDAYIRGTPLPSIAHSTVQEETASSSTRLEKSPGKSYANAVKSNSQKSLINIKSNILKPPIPQPPKNQPDDRLFLRLSNDDLLRAYSGFALLDYIKSKLGLDKELIKNVLPTKTGFALCSSKGNLKVLEEKISENKICVDALLEKASPWISYRISNILRSNGSINEKLEHILVPITTDSISDAIPSAAGANLVSISPSKDNDMSPESPSTTWIVRLSESHNRLPRVLFLLGCRTTTRILLPCLTTPQCTRCWLWHNSRVCASSPRCRLCGS